MNPEEIDTNHPGHIVLMALMQCLGAGEVNEDNADHLLMRFDNDVREEVWETMKAAKEYYTTFLAGPDRSALCVVKSALGRPGAFLLYAQLSPQK